MKTIITVVSIILVAVLGLSIFSSSLFKELESEKSEVEGYTTIKIHNKEYGIDDSIDTWGDWINSDYYTDGFFIISGGDYVAKCHYDDGSSLIVVDCFGLKVHKNDNINRDNSSIPYEFTILNPKIMFSLDGKIYRVDEGTTWGEWLEDHGDEYEVGGFHNKSDEIASKAGPANYICIKLDENVFNAVKTTDVIEADVEYGLYGPYGA